MTSIEKDKAYLEAGIPELREYLLSKELYWPISARGFDLPRLTIGSLLLAQARLEARGERIEALVAQVDGVRSKWQVAWETKAGREVQARLGLWQNYLGDYRQNPEQQADAYPYEVRNRVRIQLLMSEYDAPPFEQATMSHLDGVLRANLTAGDFIWEADLQSGFPREVYWYLYSLLKS